MADLRGVYVRGLRYIDTPILRWRDDDGDDTWCEDGETLYYCTDAKMNATSVVGEKTVGETTTW